MPKSDLSKLTKRNKLTKKERLLKPSEFQMVYKQGSWIANREIAFNYKLQSSNSENKKRQADNRLGLVVSKKVSKRAVDRNRLKRHFREWFRQNKTNFMNMDIIVTAKPALRDKTAEQILSSLNDIYYKFNKKKSLDKSLKINKNI